MSGHSHWASIKHKKGAADAKKGKVFSKLARYIMIAAKQGGSDPSMNLKLQYAVEKAKQANMPRENIDRAIKKGAGELAGVHYEESALEGYGPGGVAIMVEILTDNKNRTIHEVRSILEKNGASVGAANCVRWMFEQKGHLLIPQQNIAEDQLLSDILDAGADDLEAVADDYEITCAPAAFEPVKKALLAKKYAVKSSELTFIPKNYVAVNEETGRRLLALMDVLDDHDDVQNVYANFELPQTLTAEQA